MVSYNHLIPIDDMLKWRRHLHMYPELSHKEYETTRYIINTLKEFGGNLEISQPTPTSVTALLRGAKPGKTIALRADIDALPVKEETGLEFSSKNADVMHACGHDAHISMLLGAAKILTQMKDSLVGNVRFIFQHAEEVPPGGAPEMIEQGVLDDVDMIFAMHIWPYIPVGTVATRKGIFFASSDFFELTIQGKGSHASTPHLSIDPITIGSELINNLNNIVSRIINPFDPVVISFGEFSAGKTANVIPDTARIQASIRATTQEMRIHMKKTIEAIIEHVCEMYGAKYYLNYVLGIAPIINPDKETDYVIAAAEKVAKHVNPNALPMMSSEDFSAYLEHRPGCYYLIGAGTQEDGVEYMNHHPKFCIREEAMPYGCKMHVQIVLDRIGM